MEVLGDLVTAPGPWDAIGTVANLGFAAVVGWYLLTKSIPKMQETFSASQREDREAHLEALRALQTQFDEREKRGQIDNKDALARILQHCERESQRREDTLKVEMSLIQRALEDVREVLEQLRTGRMDMGPPPTSRRRRSTDQHLPDNNAPPVPGATERTRTEGSGEHRLP